MHILSHRLSCDPILPGKTLTSEWMHKTVPLSEAWASIPGGGQIPIFGVAGKLISMSYPKVLACYEHLCICYNCLFLPMGRRHKKLMWSLFATEANKNKQAVRVATQYPPPPVTFDLLTLKVVSESRVTWATSVPILVFLGLSVLDLGPMYATDRHQIDIR